MIYLLSKNLRKNCTLLCDSHLNESIMDTGMALSFYLWINQPENVAFDAAHYFSNGHRDSKIHRALYPVRGRQDFYNWVAESSSNYAFLMQYLIELTEEHYFRRSKHHKLAYLIPHMPKMEFKSITNNIDLELRIKACKRRYEDMPVYWTWTNRDQPQNVL